jgi:flagellar motor protein MotB
LRLETTGLGETRPIADNATEEGRAKNERIEVVRLSAQP